MKYTYTKEIKKRKPTLVKKLPKRGYWLPISIAAYLKNYPDSQMVRWLYLNDGIKGIKLPVGPVLVNLEEIPERKK